MYTLCVGGSNTKQVSIALTNLASELPSHASLASKYPNGWLRCTGLAVNQHHSMCINSSCMSGGWCNDDHTQ